MSKENLLQFDKEHSVDKELLRELDDIGEVDYDAIPLMDHNITNNNNNINIYNKKIRRSLRVNRCLLVTILIMLILLFILFVGLVVGSYYEIMPFIKKINSLFEQVNTNNLPSLLQDLGTVVKTVNKFKDVDITNWNNAISSIGPLESTVSGYSQNITTIISYLNEFSKLLRKYHIE